MFKIAASLEDLSKVFSVRAIVFIEELGQPYAAEFDGQDTSSSHILGEESCEPIASGRIRLLEGQARFERIAVRKSWRRKGLGRKLVDYMRAVAESQGLSQCVVDARPEQRAFFEKLGFCLQDSAADPMVSGLCRLVCPVGALRPPVDEAARSTGSCSKKAPETAPLPPGVDHESVDKGEHFLGEGQRHTCAVSGVPFTISKRDLEFYERFEVPPPTLCPEERARLRMSFANQRSLYYRQCSGSKKRIISNYAPEQDVPVYDIEYWYSDKWDQYATGREYDFNRPFFEQFGDLLRVAPRPSLQREPHFDENADFTNYAGKNKNCYLIFDSDKNWDCYYSYSINSCQDVMDCFRLEKSELCYECIDCTNCYSSSYLQNCDNCSNSAYLKNCIGCAECFGSVNLRNKTHYFFNERLTKVEYDKKLATLGLHLASKSGAMRQQFIEYARQFPSRWMEGVQNEDVIGDYLTYSKDAHCCFDSRKLWSCRYIIQAFDDVKDSIDCVEVGDGAELLYESCYVGYKAHFDRFTTHALGQSSDLTYCYYTPHCADCFGCVGLHHAQFCILNRRYDEAQYRELVPKIIAHMKQTGEWGQFFPPRLAPFPYNKTHAHEYYPLTKEQALERGYTWQDEEPKEYQPSPYQVPDSIDEVKDDILDAALSCEKTGKNYKLQQKELLFYQRMRLPVPRLCPDERHLGRLALRNPRTLYRRQSAVSGEEIITTLGPAEAAEVLGEEEFQQAME